MEFAAGAREKYPASKPSGLGGIVLGGLFSSARVICVQILCVCVCLFMLQPRTADHMRSVPG